MFCANCGKKVEEDAQFCPHCGARAREPEAEVTGAVPAAPESAEPAPVPEPSAPTLTQVPTPTPSAGAPTEPPRQLVTSAPEQPQAPPGEIPPVAPPPGVTPPLAEEGEPPKKKSSTCWIVGCIILAVVVILGGVGTCLVTRYFYTRSTQVIQEVQQQMQDQGGQPGAESGEAGSPIDDIQPDVVQPPEDMGQALQDIMDQVGQLGGGQAWQDAMENMASAPPAVAVYQFIFTWRTGEPAAIRALVTPELAADLDEYLPQGDLLQVGADLQEKTKVSETEWEYVIAENLVPRSGGEQTTDRHRIRVVRSGDKWLVSEIESLGN